MDCISKLTCDDKIFLNETIGKITEMIESKGDSLTQRQREYIEMLDRVYDLKTVNKTESFLGGIIRTIGFATSSISGKKMLDYEPNLPIIKMCMEFVYIRNNKHEYDEFSEVFDELPVSRKDFKNICSEIDKEAVNGIEHIINKYEIAKNIAHITFVIRAILKLISARIYSLGNFFITSATEPCKSSNCCA